MKVRFYSIDEIEHFINDMNALECDVNLLDGRQVFDAKSTIGIMNLDFRNKVFKVECITDDPEQIHKFKERIKRYVTDS